MSANADHSPIDAVVQRLTERFPSVPPDRVAAIVDEELHRFDGAKVTEFVPVLVEHEAHEVLRREATPVPLSEQSATAIVAGHAVEPDLDPLEVERRTEQTGLLLGELDN
ncbi:three-helix bundle dimerization domain-containing protein [Microbacterium sulfonylureivorans]|uniref:three-helix bundle dimerization domain-containing protein n=1 Tax=Microbacterium sulfonylureivorans TaxID=2486854 RepID=UPI000FD8516C|nr:hypothetical protein [Microbacterium sulfonylureivorans]